ncbi:MAG: PaaI family thioesterase [Gammaproteobacteria bacterium]|nr:PaaI family thioesterase [Gammaproteobacteria bacterium]
MSTTPKFEYDEKIAAGFLANRGGAGGLVEYLGLRITEAGPGTMTGEAEVKKEFMTGIGNMHGGILSAVCDHMLGCVCYPVMKRGQWAATTEFKINLTAPVSKGTLTARAEILNLGRTQAVVRIDVENEGRVCAMAQGTVTIRDPK